VNRRGHDFACRDPGPATSRGSSRKGASFFLIQMESWNSAVLVLLKTFLPCLLVLQRDLDISAAAMALKMFLWT
jgi:hypothetical protein